MSTDPPFTSESPSPTGGASPSPSTPPPSTPPSSGTPSLTPPPSTTSPPSTSPSPSTSTSPTPSPSLVSPCPHTPRCPPPVCLPPSLRAPASPSPSRPAGNPKEPGDSGGKSNLPGYESQTGSIDRFAGSMSGAAQGVGLVKEVTPRFEGWNLVPLAGVPLVGRMFVGRYNGISDTWRDSAGILRTVLDNDSQKVTRAAQNYRNAERPG